METLRIQHPSDGILLLTINRPQAHNALDLATMRAFATLMDELTDDDSLRVLVIAGAGTKAFCSGGDLNDLSQYPSAADGMTMITLMGDALLALERLTVPVIAAINGYALGGGSELALACDLRVVDAEAKLGTVHIRRGLIPGWGGGQRLLRLVGYTRAMEILLRGQVMHAEQLLALGLANRVVSVGQAVDSALELAREIAQADASAVRAVKALLQAGLNQPYQAALDSERRLFPALWVGDAHVKAMQDFVQKQSRK